jgi:hypothetical protein
MDFLWDYNVSYSLLPTFLDVKYVAICKYRINRWYVVRRHYCVCTYCHNCKYEHFIWATFAYCILCANYTRFHFFILHLIAHIQHFAIHSTGRHDIRVQDFPCILAHISFRNFDHIPYWDAFKYSQKSIYIILRRWSYQIGKAIETKISKEYGIWVITLVFWTM